MLQLQVSGRRRAFSRLKAQWFSSSCRCRRDMYAGVGAPWRRGVESGFVMRRHAPLSRLWMLCLPSRAASKTPRPRHGRKGSPSMGHVWGTKQCQSATQPPSHPDVGHARLKADRQAVGGRFSNIFTHSLAGSCRPCVCLYSPLQ